MQRSQRTSRSRHSSTPKPTYNIEAQFKRILQEFDLSVSSAEDDDENFGEGYRRYFRKTPNEPCEEISEVEHDGEVYAVGDDVLVRAAGECILHIKVESPHL